MSDRKRVRELYTAFLVGQLAEPGSQELMRLLEQDEASRREIIDDMEIHGLLGQLNNDADAEMFRRSLVERIEAEESPSRMVRAVMSDGGVSGPAHARRRARRRPGGGYGPFWSWALIAAMFMVAIILFINVRRPQQRDPAGRTPAELAERGPREEPRPAEQQTPASKEEKRAAQRLIDIEREKERLLQERRKAEANQEKEAQEAIRQALERNEAARRQSEAEIERARATQRPPTEEAAPAKDLPPEDKQRKTVVVAATIEKIHGEVHVRGEGGRGKAKAPQTLTAGEGLETGGGTSAAFVRFADGTRLQIGNDTVIDSLADSRAATAGKRAEGKRLSIARGLLLADVARQPDGQPMIITTPHAEARVLGTSLRLTVESDATILTVTEGKVRVTRSKDGKFLDVTGGQHAIAAAGVELAAKPDLVVNPGFEIGERTPLGWLFVTVDGNTPTWDATTAHTGTRSVRIHVAGSADRKSGEARAFVSLQPMKNYLFAAWGKCEDTGGTAAPAVRVYQYDVNHKRVGTTNLEFSRGTTAWMQKKTRVRTSAETEYALVYANIWNGYGTFWVDDVSLSPQ